MHRSARVRRPGNPRWGRHRRIHESRRSQVEPPDPSEIARREPARARGRVGVRVPASDAAVTWDVFGRDGRYRGTAVAALAVPSYWAPTILGDRFYMLHIDEPGVPYVVRARIRESEPGVTAGEGPP